MQVKSFLGINTITQETIVRHFPLIYVRDLCSMLELKQFVHSSTYCTLFILP